MIEPTNYIIGLLRQANAPNARKYLGILSNTGGGSVNFSAGTTSNFLAGITFGNANGVSFGLNAGTLTASIAPGGGAITNVNISAGSTSNDLSAFTFNNGNGVTFGLNASTLTASVQTNYQSPGAYLTTAALSQDSSKYAGTNFSTQSTAGSDIQGTLNTSGLTLGIPAYLTAATASGLSAVNVSAGTLSSNVSAITFSNGSGVSFGFDGSNITATVATNYQSPGAYLTTAALSQDSSKYAGTNFATTSSAGVVIAGTMNTSGLTLGVPAFLTTAMASNAATISNIKVSAGTLSSNRSDITFANSNNVSFGLDTNGVITASFSATAAAGSGVVSLNGSSGQLSIVGSGLNSISNNASSIVVSARSESLNEIQDPTTDKVFSMGSNMLDFEFAGGGSFSTNATRMGMFVIHHNGNLTSEADLLHVHQHGGAPSTLDLAHFEADGANVTCLRLQASGTICAEINQPIKFTTANSNYAIGSVPFILNASMSNMVASLNADLLDGKHSSELTAGGGMSALVVAAAGSTNSVSQVTFSNSNNVSFGLNGSVITATASISGVFAPNTLSYFFQPSDIFPNNPSAITTVRSGFYVDPFMMPNYASFDYLRFPVSQSFAGTTYATSNAATTYSCSRVSSLWFGIYTLGTGVSSSSLMSLINTSVGLTLFWSLSETGSRYSLSFSGTVPSATGNSNVTSSAAFSSGSIVANLHTNALNPLLVVQIDLPLPMSFSPGNYWMAIGMDTGISSNGDSRLGNANLSFSTLGITEFSRVGFFSSGVAQLAMRLGQGRYNNSVASLPPSIPLGNVAAVTAAPCRIFWQGIRQA